MMPEERESPLGKLPRLRNSNLSVSQSLLMTILEAIWTMRTRTLILMQTRVSSRFVTNSPDRLH